MSHLGEVRGFRQILLLFLVCLEDFLKVEIGMQTGTLCLLSLDPRDFLKNERLSATGSLRERN